MRGKQHRSDTQTSAGSQPITRRARAGAVGGTQYATSATNASTQKSDSQVPSQRASTLEMQWEAYEEAVPVKKINVPHMLLRPWIVPRLLLQSVAGIYWIQVRTQLRFFPLGYLQPQTEDDYRKILNKTFRIRMPIGMALLALNSLLSWVLVGLGRQNGWIVLQTEHAFVWRGFHMISFLACAASGIGILIPFLKWTQEQAEFWFYICSGINNTAWLVWACWSVVSAKPDTSKATSMEQAEEILRHYFEFKMVVDALATGILVSVLVNSDIFLHTLSSRSIWFHLYTWGLFTGSRLAQNPTLADASDIMIVTTGIDTGNAFILYFVGWGCRWFRELQDRAVVISVKESQAKLTRVRETQRTRRRRKDHSAAEEIIDLLNQCKITLSDTKLIWTKTSKTSTTSLDEATLLILDCIKTLATGSDSMSQVKRSSAPGARDDEEMEEDAFIEMYKTNKAVLQKSDDPNSQRKSRGGTRSRSEQGTGSGIVKKVTIKGSEQILFKVNYFGLDFPGLHLYDIFQSAVGKDFGLRILDYKKRTPVILSEVGFVLLQPHLNYLECDEPCLIGCLYALEHFYFPGNPYHTSCHAANVAHCAVTILQMCNLLNYVLDLEKIGFIIAALGHDIGHPGRTNNFYINANNILAIAQNDVAVLESAHAIITQNVITSCPEVNILGGLSKLEYMAVRKIMITLILSTDMSKHYELLSKARVRRVSPEFDARTNEQDRQMVMGLAFKAADLGHATLDWSQHLDWSLRISEEYYQQGEDEKTLGIPISPLCNRAEHRSYAKTQSGFLQFVVAPLVEELMELDDSGMIGMEMMTKLLFNKQKWESLAETHKCPEIPVSVASSKIAPALWTHFAFSVSLRSKTVSDLILEATPALIARL